MTNQSPQEDRSKDKQYLHLASATEKDVDAFIDALLESAHNPHYVNPTQVIRMTLAAFQVDTAQIEAFWSQKAITDGREGVLAVVQLKSGEWWSVINCPIIPLVRGGRTINPEALPALLEYAEGLV